VSFLRRRRGEELPCDPLIGLLASAVIPLDECGPLAEQLQEQRGLDTCAGADREFGG
jgi:hypothetical protein